MAINDGLCTVVCQEPFLKSSFILRALRTTKIPIFYLDFDLMYSGCIKGGFAEKPDNVQVHMMDFSNYVDVIKTVTSEITKKKHLVILDTLNGFFSMHGGEAGRMINTCISLLAFAAKNTDSSILTVCMASHVKKKWILSPALGKILHQGSKICLRKNDANMIADMFDRSDNPIGSVVC